MVLRQSTPAGPRVQALRAHQAFDPVQAAGYAFGEDVVPDPTSAIGAIAANVTGPDPDADLVILASAS